jgi:hypothetical protein
MHVLQEVGAEGALDIETEDLGPGVVEVAPVAERIGLEHDLAETVEHRYTAVAPSTSVIVRGARQIWKRSSGWL